MFERIFSGRIFGVAGALVLVAAALAADESAAGIRWSVPRGWSKEPPRPMRVATYHFSEAKGAASGECGVFYFGRRQGGSVEENLARWTAQFEAAAPAKKTERMVHGMRVHRLDLSGTYLAPGGPRMQPQGKLANYRLLGAIVEAPDGLVYFKCTGPAAAVAAAEADFDRMIGSVAKAGESV